MRKTTKRERQELYKSIPGLSPKVSRGEVVHHYEQDRRREKVEPGIAACYYKGEIRSYVVKLSLPGRRKVYEYINVGAEGSREAALEKAREVHIRLKAKYGKK